MVQGVMASPNHQQGRTVHAFVRQHGLHRFRTSPPRVTVEVSVSQRRRDMALDPGRREIVSVEIAADPDTVWAHVREPAKIRRWFGWHDDGIDDEIHRVFVAYAQVGEWDELAALARAVRSLIWKCGDRFTVWP